jgi:hypothetical protein
VVPVWGGESRKEVVMSKVVLLREIEFTDDPKFTVQSNRESGGWWIQGVLDGVTVDGVEVEGIATIDRAFMIPGGSHRSPETYIECGDMVSLDAEMSACAFNAVIANVREVYSHEFYVCGKPPWVHLGEVEVKEEHQGQRMSHRIVSGFIEFIESFVNGEIVPYVLTASCAEGLVPHWEALGFKVWGRVHDFEKEVHVLLLRLGGELRMPPVLEDGFGVPSPNDFQGWIKEESGGGRRTSVLTDAAFRVFKQELCSRDEGWDVRLMKWVNNDGGLAHAPCFPIVVHNRDEGRVLLLGTEDKGWWAVGRRVVELRGTGEYRGADKSRFEVVRQSDPFEGRGWRGEMLSTGFAWVVGGVNG